MSGNRIPRIHASDVDVHAYRNFLFTYASRYNAGIVHKFRVRECNARGYTTDGTCTVKPKTHNFHFPPRNCRVISLANKERRPGVRVSCYSINYSINYRARLACTGIRGDVKSSTGPRGITGQPRNGILTPTAIETEPNRN